MSAKINFDYLLVLSRGAVALADNSKFVSSLTPKASAAESISALLVAGNVRKRSRLLVLSEDFFRQTVRLPSVQVDGLSAPELTTALCYEIEPFSNIPENAGLLAFEPLEPRDGESVFDVLQISDSEYAAIANSAEAAGCRLIAAGGLPEGWSGGEEPQNFAEFVKSVNEGTSRMPFAKKTSGGMVPDNPFPLAAILSCAVVAVCLIDMLVLKSSLSSMKPDIARRSALAAANQSVVAEISSVNSECAHLKKAEEARIAAERKSGRVSAAWSRAFSAISSVSTDNAVITSISADGNFGCRVDALAASVEGAGLYMKSLTEKLNDSGWVLSPGVFSNSAAGGSVVFSFTLTYPEMAVGSQNGASIAGQW